MAYRIELLFVGDAPEDDLRRSKILGHPDFEKAIAAAHDALAAIGFVNEYTVRTVRSTPNRSRSGRRPVEGRLQPQAAE